MKKRIAMILALVMIATMVPAMSFADGFSDMPQDWSTEALTAAVDNGLLMGSNGKLMPSENLTRAQMATIINRAFGAYEKASLAGFTDVSETSWYKDEMAKAAQMRTFKGDGNKLNPDNNITREEAFIVMARAMKLEASGVAPEGFSDLDKISIWAKGEVYALINAGYVKGSNGLINPQGYITRAEFAQLMFNMIKTYVNVADEYTGLGEGNVMINVPDVVLRDMTIEGDLIAGDGIGDGNLTLDNVVIEGRLVVRGGGVDSILIKGGTSIGSTLVVSRYDGAVRVFFEDGTEADVIYIEDGEDKVIVEGKVDKVIVNADVPVALQNAEVGEIRMNAVGSDVFVDEDSTVASILIFKEAEGAKVGIEGKVTSLVTAAPQTSVAGSGSVEVLEVMGTGEGYEIDVEVTTTVISEDLTVTEEAEEPSTGGGGGGGGGGGTPAPKIEEAWLNSVEATINGGKILVPFSFNAKDDYVIRVVFNKTVSIKSVNFVGWDLIKDIYSIPTDLTKEVSIYIHHEITENHFDAFGNEVIITVTDGSTPVSFEIELQR